MDILNQIKNALNTYDPEALFEDSELNSEILNGDIYQNSMDAAAEPEDLNFSMDSITDLDSSDAEIPHFSIPQQDLDKKEIELGDRVENVARPGRVGTVLAIGELIEVEWKEGITSMEYPEELIHAEDNSAEEQEKVTSIEAMPPIPIKNKEE